MENLQVLLMGVQEGGKIIALEKGKFKRKFYLKIKPDPESCLKLADTFNIEEAG